MRLNILKIVSEVDPVDWGSIIGTMGGYWVYVGLAFSLWFAKNPNKKDGHLHPSTLATKCFFCVKEKDPYAVTVDLKDKLKEASGAD